MTKKDISKKPARAKKIVRRDEQRDYDRIEAEIAAISDIVPSQENLWKDKEYEGYVPPRALCCMFEQEDAEKAVNESNLEFIEELFKSNRHSHFLCRCRKCGALVIQQYEELITFDWDNADCFDRYFPVGSMEEARELIKAYPFAHLAGVRKHIRVSYTEEDSVHKFYGYYGRDFNGK